MIVITLTDTPPKVRGDLSKWLLEVNTGVYVGNVSARVREEIWERVCENLKNGRATMVYNSQNEQKMDFRVHNSAWEPVDFDGLKLIRHPSVNDRRDQTDVPIKKGFSKAAKRAYVRNRANTSLVEDKTSRYTVIDLETTGLSSVKDDIIEVAALHVVNGKVTDEFSRLIKVENPLPEYVVQLTGITDEMLAVNGESLNDVLKQFDEFIGEETIVGHNVAFDLNFILEACRKNEISAPQNFKTVDTLQIAKKKIKGLSDYKLGTLGQYFDIDINSSHRALQDCYLTFAIYEKLIKSND